MKPTNPLMIVPLLMHWKRPSSISDMPALALPFWIRKGYDGLTFFGHIITHSKEEADHLNTHFDSMKVHEMIHLYQARTTHDSWLCFYWKYFVYWLQGCRYRSHLRNAGYLLNPFEMEAYAHMHDPHYLPQNPEGCSEWKYYASLPLSERLVLIRQKLRR